MIQWAETAWLRLLQGCLRWRAAAQWLRDPDSAAFARSVADAYAMRLCEPEQGQVEEAARVLAAKRR